MDAAARLRAQYQRANDALADEEAPSPAVRAAVLAAAARQVQARPQPVGARPRWRVPLAAAASVLVGTLAVVLATRHDDSTTKTVVTSEAAVPQGVPQSAAPPVSPMAAPALAQNAPTPGQDTARAASAQAPAAPPPSVVASAAPPLAPAVPSAVSALPAAPAAESPTASASGGVAGEARTERRAQRDMQAAPAPAAESVAPVDRSKTEAAVRAQAALPPSMQGSNAMSSERTSDPGAGAASRSAAPPPRAAAPAAPAAPAAAPSAEQQVKARPVQRTAPMADAAPPAALSPEDANRWITRIVELRRAGRDSEADAELKALRERAPTLTLPPEALPRLGSR
jgi:hypothetical protein